jgi:hypothetical protein
VPLEKKDPFFNVLRGTAKEVGKTILQPWKMSWSQRDVKACGEDGYLSQQRLAKWIP